MLNSIKNINFKKYKKEGLAIILGLILVALLYIIFFSSAINTYLGNTHYFNSDFNKANDYYEKVLDSNYSFIGNNNIGNSNYKKRKYSESIEDYERGIEECTSHCDTLLYNLGNSYYKQGKTLQGKEKVAMYKKAIESYEKSLEIKEDQEALDNLEFVKKELEQAKEEAQQEGDSESSDEGTEGQSDEGEQESSEFQTEEGADGKGGEEEQSDKGSEGQSEEGGDSASSAEGQASALDEQTKEDIENYMQQLEQIEKDAQKYYQRNPNEKQNGDEADNFFEDFFGRENPFSNDPFFNPQLNQNPNSNGTEKDW